MLIIPAIDIKGGLVVRLKQGRFDKGQTIYPEEPAEIAGKWAGQGAKLIHVVDLDGAALGRPKNLDKVKDILAAVKIPVEFGGGVRHIDTIKELIGLGISRVVLGTKAVEDRNFLEEAYAKFKGKVIVSIDAKAGHILTKGWQSSFENAEVLDFARSLKETGFEEIIYTDVTKDGTLKGPNTEAVEHLLDKTGIKIIASGGVSSLSDLGRLKSLEKKGLSGVIIGKALYEAKFTLKDALRFS
ncbi:MAG: 1-(5-phosphoribosyl)-5-[(5-phosphoribosylamino)methylideneamino]imidazole-4-carboxamide isomerase [Candidatus Omnitrophica bacterium]|nr:1-(5-phosphoribosyl)-5-[(5-phosphoribosylamino)methylideneamino]imidazole-4-carboxamide isomerase [Candidatus Omnitrophota bacterium]